VARWGRGRGCDGGNSRVLLEPLLNKGHSTFLLVVCATTVRGYIYPTFLSSFPQKKINKTKGKIIKLPKNCVVKRKMDVKEGKSYKVPK
jgi:hypothetical protein